MRLFSFSCDTLRMLLTMCIIFIYVDYGVIVFHTMKV